MAKKIAFDLTDGSNSGVSYYAKDSFSEQVLPENNYEEDFLSLFEDDEYSFDEDENLSISLDSSHLEADEPALLLNDEPEGVSLEADELGADEPMLLLNDEVQDIDQDMDDSEPHVLMFDQEQGPLEEEEDEQVLLVEEEEEEEEEADKGESDDSDDEDNEVSQEAFDGLILGDDKLPGAKVIFVTKKEEPERATTWEDDEDHSKFIPYMIRALHSIPPHSGQTTVGCEKAITYLRKLDKEISRAIQSDAKNLIDETSAEKMRDTIHDYITRLDEALDALVGKKRKKKKKASLSIGKKIVARINDGEDIQYFASIAAADGTETLLKVALEEPSDEQVQNFMRGTQNKLTKEAGQLVTFVDPFLQSITRLLIKSHVTHGKDLREVYAQLDEQYNFTPRESLSIHELMLQKGMPMYVDLGRLNEKGPKTSTDGKNIEFSTEYYA